MKFILFITIFILLQNSYQFLLPNNRYKRQVITGPESNIEPGYLPDYRGDKYTDPQRIKDTQELNKPFFDSIGGEPVYPGGVPPKNSILTPTNTLNYNQQYSNEALQYNTNNNYETSNPYSTIINPIANENYYDDKNTLYTTSIYPNQIQRDYFVPNTYETSTTSYGIQNSGYLSSTTHNNNQIPSIPYSTNGPIWQSANPGFLPDYRGDKYTDPQRILDTQNLNKKFFESIGGEPVYPGGVPPKQTITTPSTIV